MFGNIRQVRNVTDPTLTPFLPNSSEATGAAVVVAPGGGFVMLSMDSEGHVVARWLAKHGVAALAIAHRGRRLRGRSVLWSTQPKCDNAMRVTPKPPVTLRLPSPFNTLN